MKESIKFNCACSGGKSCGYLWVSDFLNGDVAFDVYRYEKKKDVCIGGAILNKRAVKKLINLLIVCQEN